MHGLSHSTLRQIANSVMVFPSGCYITNKIDFKKDMWNLAGDIAPAH